MPLALGLIDVDIVRVAELVTVPLAELLLVLDPDCVNVGVAVDVLDGDALFVRVADTVDEEVPLLLAELVGERVRVNVLLEVAVDEAEPEPDPD